MKFINHYLFVAFLFPFIFSSDNKNSGLDYGSRTKSLIGNLYVVSVGINKYKYNELENCVNDAKALVEKIKSDNNDLKLNLKKLQEKIKNKQGNSEALIEEYKNEKTKLVKKIFAYQFFDEKATLKNIKDTFKAIIQNAKPEDSFVFFFAGKSFSLDNYDTAFILFQESFFNWMKPLQNVIIKTSELASLMNQISCNNQLIISEAGGSGSEFSNSLMSFLFEGNLDIGDNTELNRTILTTHGLGYGKSNCDKNHGPLVYYILKSGNMIDVFKDMRKYELELQKHQIDCPKNERAYFIIRRDSDFRDLLAFNHKKFKSRGTRIKSNKKIVKKEDKISKTFAFIIGTDKYNQNQNSWDNLDNPIKDAEEVANLLKTKYGAEVKKVYNKPKNEILKEFINFKRKIDKKDKLICFVAGHGYYNEDLSYGFLVLNDSYSLEDDTYLGSYLPMAKLTRLLDGTPCKQVFTIFDVCFGASFDSNAKDLKLSNYSKEKSDISIDEFIKRKDKYTSRIFLASGKSEVPDFWNNSLNHSPFANKLIQYLKNEKEFLSPSKIYEAVEANITEPILKSHDKHEERGDFILKVQD